MSPPPSSSIACKLTCCLVVQNILTIMLALRCSVRLVLSMSRGQLHLVKATPVAADKSGKLRLDQHHKSCSTQAQDTEKKTEDVVVDDNETQTAEDVTLQSTQILEGLGQNIVGSLRRPKALDTKKSKDRRIPIPWQTGLRYMESKAYQDAYGQYTVWQLFRRNFPASFSHMPSNTRISCVGDDGFIMYGQACPICRDEYLVLHYKNAKLLKQFINPWTGLVYPAYKTNLCQKKHEEMLVALYQAKDYGTLSFHIPFREYDYNDYYRKEDLKGLQIESGFDDSQDPVLQKALEDPDFGGSHEFARESFP